MKIIDLSKPICYNKNDPWFMRVKVKHKPHSRAKWLIRVLGLPFKLFPIGFNGWADDTIVQMGVHSTTHIDAPWHYSPTVAGKKAKTAEQIPLEKCYADGMVIDMQHKPDFEAISVADMERFLADNALELKPGTIVLIRTGRAKYNGTPDFHKRGTGMSAEATEWLIDRGISVMGIDQWGWDLPLPYQAEQAKKTGNSELFWEAHLVGQRKEYFHMEQLVNLEALPLSGFKVCCFPLKLVGASAAPARVVAIID